jgi:hypothetical protein
MLASARVQQLVCAALATAGCNAILDIPAPSPTPDAAPASPADAARDLRAACDHDAPFVRVAPVHELNTRSPEQTLWLTSDERTVLFSRKLEGRSGELFIAHRDARADSFGDAEPIAALNTPGDELRAVLSPDRHTVYFDRDDGTGYAIMAAAWGGAPRLVEGVNGDRSDYEPFVTEAGIYLGSTRDSSISQIYFAPRRGAGFAEVQPIPGVNSGPYAEENPVPSADGLALYFSAADRPPLGRSWDVWVATRSSIDEPFASARLVAGDDLNTVGAELPGWISDDNCRLYFTTDRGAGQDFWVASRDPS